MHQSLLTFYKERNIPSNHLHGKPPNTFESSSVRPRLYQAARKDATEGKRRGGEIHAPPPGKKRRARFGGGALLEGKGKDGASDVKKD